MWTSVQRVRLDDGRTVIVKERRRTDDWGADPAQLRNERAALEALTHLGLGGVLAPAYLAGDDDAGVLVMGDVGRTNVEALVLDPSAGEAAAAALVEHGRALGRLHAATVTAEAHETFVARRSALSAHDPVAARTSFLTNQLPDLWAEERDIVAGLGFPSPSPAVEDEVVDLFRRLTDPGPCLALTHLDASPQNGVLGADGSVRLVDFEGAQLRHLGLDACFLRFPFPSYGHWALLPESLRAAMEDAYRAELPSAVDCDGAMAVGCAALTILRAHRLPRIADGGDEALRRRTQLVATLEVAADAAETALPNLAGWFRSLADEARRRWDEARQPPRTFAAFA